MPVETSQTRNGAPRRRDRWRGGLAGFALALAGGVMLALAGSQPAWVDDRIGPGLMARLLGLGVIALGAAWALIALLTARPVAYAAPLPGCNTGGEVKGLPFSGLALLGAVLAFCLVLPLAGLVLSAGVAAALAAWGAGERAWRGLGVTVVALMTLVAAIGHLLLPPTAPLWPAL